jgi:hypothetical protein
MMQCPLKPSVRKELAADESTMIQCLAAAMKVKVRDHTVVNSENVRIPTHATVMASGQIIERSKVLNQVGEAGTSKSASSKVFLL